MLSTRLNKLLFGFTLSIYIVAVGAAVFGLITLRSYLRSDRVGDLQVEKVLVETGESGSPQLVIKGAGFNEDIRAVVATLPAVVDHQFFLGRDVGRGLWTDGQTILASYRGSRMLNLRLLASGDLTVVGSVDLPGDIDQLVKIGDRVLVSLGPAGFCLVDLSVASQPLLLDHRWESDLGFPPVRSMLVSASRVYVPFRHGRLAIFDMGQGEVPMTLVDVASRPWKGAMQGKRLVTGDLHGNLQLFELDSQGLPLPVGRMGFEKEIRAIAMSDTSLFVAVGNEKLYSFDLHRWPRLVEGTLKELPGNILDLRLVPETPLLLVSRASLGLLSLNIAEPASPKVVSEFLQAFTPYEIQVVDQKVICAGNLGLAAAELDQVLAGTSASRTILEDLDHNLHSWDEQIYLLPLAEADPSEERPPRQAGDRLHPARSLENHQAGDLPAEESAERPAAEDLCRVFPGYRSLDKLQVYCRDPAGGSPRLRSTLKLFNPEAGLWRQGLIYTVNHSLEKSHQRRNGYLRIFNAVNPEKPELVGKLSLLGSLRDLAWLEPHFVVVSAGQSGLYVVDVGKPAAPRLVGHMPLPFHLRKMAQTTKLLWVGNRMYVSHQRAGVSLVDLSDIRHPRIRQLLNLPGFAKNMIWQDDFVFVSLHREGVFMIDASIGQGLAPIGILETPVNAYDLAASRGKLAVSGAASGLFQMPLPRKLDVTIQSRSRALIPLPKDLASGQYRLYLYNGRESLRVDTAFEIDAEAARSLAQNE